MGNSGNDVIHIKPHKMKTRCQNQLKIAGRIYFEVFYRTRHKKIEVMMIVYLSNAPLIQLKNYALLASNKSRQYHSKVKNIISAELVESGLEPRNSM